MKFREYIRFRTILKPKKQLMYSRLYKSVKENEKELIGSEI